MTFADLTMIDAIVLNSTYSASIDRGMNLNPNAAKIGGLQAKALRVEPILLRAHGKAENGALRLSRRAKKMEKTEPFPEYTANTFQPSNQFLL